MTTRVTEGARRERHYAYFIGSGYAGSLSFFFSGCRPRFSRLAASLLKLARVHSPYQTWRKRESARSLGLTIFLLLAKAVKVVRLTDTDLTNFPFLANILCFFSAACKPGYISLDFALINTSVAGRQRGGAVRALDYSLLDLFSVVLRSNPQPRLYNSQLVRLQASCWDL